MRKLLIALGMLCMPAVAHAEWHKATSDHFEVYADGDAEWVKEYAENLERFDSGSRRLRNLPADSFPGANRVTIYLVPRDLFAKIVPASIGGFYNPNGAVPRIFIPNRGITGKPDTTLLHEYTHHLLHVAWSSVAIPGWLGEGMAQLSSTAEVRSDGALVFGRELPQARWMMRGLTEEDVRDMVTKSTAPTGESIYYSGGWLMSHMLTFGKKRQGELANYIVAVNQGKDTEEAAKEAFGNLEKLSGDLERYKRGTSLPGAVIPADELKIGKVSVETLSPGQQATIELAIQSQAGVDEEEAALVYAKAKTVAAGFADDPGAQRMLAEAAYDADDFAASLAAADRVLAKDPTNSEAYAYKVKAMKELGSSIEDRRAVLDKGLRFLPNDPGLLHLYYRSFLDAGEVPPAIAKARLIQAYKIAPQIPSLRADLVHQLLQDGNTADARAVIRPLAYNVHKSKSAKRAREALEAIQEGDTKAALAALEKVEEDAAEDGAGEGAGEGDGEE